MTLVLHLMRKDLHRLRWDVTTYAVLVVVAASLLVLGSRPGDSAWQWFVGIQALLLIAIAAQVVQIDALVGTTAFWRTRPIPRAVLLTSKLLLAMGLLVVFPAVVTMLAARAGGLFWQDALAAGFSAALVQAFLVFAALAIGSITSTLTAFVLTSLAAVGSLLIFNFAFDLARALSNRPEAIAAQSLVFSRMYAAFGLLLLGSAIVPPIQALGLRTKRSVLVAALVSFLAVGVVKAWPADFMAEPVAPADASVIDPNAVVLGWQPDRVGIEKGIKRNVWDRKYSFVTAGLTWTEVPAGIVVDAVSLRATFRDARGKEWRFEEAPARPSRAIVSNAPILNARYRALKHALGDIELERENYWSIDGGAFMVMRVPEASFSEVEGQQGVLTLDVDFDVAQFRAIAAAPLAQGARLIYPARSAMIEDVRLANVGDARRLTVRLRGAELGRPHAALPFAGETVIRHRSRRSALLARPSGPMPYYDLRPFEPLPNYLTFHEQVLVGGMFEAEGVDESWLDGAELVRVESVRLGRITRSLRIPDFVVRETSRR